MAELPWPRAMRANPLKVRSGRVNPTLMGDVKLDTRLVGSDYIKAYNYLIVRDIATKPRHAPRDAGLFVFVLFLFCCGRIFFVSKKYS